MPPHGNLEQEFAALFRQKQLRLSGLSQSLEVRLQEAKASKLDHAEFLELILADELIVRRDRRIEWRARAAASATRNRSTTSTSSSTVGQTQLIYDLATGDFVRKQNDAILVGPPGVVQSIGRQLIRDGYTVY